MESVQLEVGVLARALERRSISLLDGARGLSALRHQVGVKHDDADFSVFVVIDSETDHLPNDSARAHSAPSWLAQCDQELSEVEAFYRNAINTATSNLIARFPAPPAALDPSKRGRPVD